VSADVVVVVGRPASGKSTIAARIAERWNLPIVAKDTVKETLFDTLGTGDTVWSMKLGRAAFALLDYVIELQLRSGRSFLIDAAYDARFEDAKFQAWQRTYGFQAVQVHCTAPTEVLVERFATRADDGSRHAGHADLDRIEEFRRTLADGRPEILDVDGPILEYESRNEGSARELLKRLEPVLGAQTH
jgi:predicted kinase